MGILRRGGRRIRSAVCLTMLILGVGQARISRAKDLTFNFHLWEEVGADQVHRSSPFNPGNYLLKLPTLSNSLVAAGEATYSVNSRVKIAGSFFNRYDHKAGDTDRLRLKEAYLSWSIDPHWDLTAGKKILKWGAGYAWNPTGVLDPPRDPRDPTDRLSQYEGRELVELRGTFGNRNFTAVYTSPRLFSKLQTRRREDQWAIKYNSLVKGLDYSLIASLGGANAANRYGANATYVIGQALELHGEFIAQRGSRVVYPLSIVRDDPPATYGFPPYARLKEHEDRIYYKTLAGGNYTFRSGWNLVIEYFRDPSGLSPIEEHRLETFITYNEEQYRLAAGPNPSTITLPGANLLWTLEGIRGFNRSRNYAFARISRSRIARKWDLENIAILSLRDRSSIWIPQVAFDFNERFGAYLRFSYYAGGRISEFGSLPWRSAWIMGLAFRL